jgi:hypothetical protein
MGMHRLNVYHCGSNGNSCLHAYCRQQWNVMHYYDLPVVVNVAMIQQNARKRRGVAHQVVAARQLLEAVHQ